MINLFFPVDCPGCDGPLDEPDATWCGTCAAALLAVTGQDYCPRCGMPVGPHLRNVAGCAACRNDRTPLDGIARAGPYEGPIGQLVRRFKFNRRQALDRPLGELIASAMDAADWADGLDGLIPVPSTWASRWRYRGEPAGLLAEAAGRYRGLPLLPLLSVRGKQHKQTDLSHSARPGNVRGVFRLRRGARVDGARLCVIDDVCTSGSTLREIARVLKRAGAEAVYGAVAAKTTYGDDGVRLVL